MDTLAMWLIILALVGGLMRFGDFLEVVFNRIMEIRKLRRDIKEIEEKINEENFDG